jgi:hypothetical protein
MIYLNPIYIIKDICGYLKNIINFIAIIKSVKYNEIF